VIQALAPSLGVELRPIDVREASEIERALAVSHRAPTAASSWPAVRERRRTAT
jgi:hypothetical protein